MIVVSFSIVRLIPDVKYFNYSSVEDISSEGIITPETFVVLTTRNMNIDIALLPYLIDQSPKYIGVIGSERRWISTKKEIRMSWVLNKQELEKIYSPIGIDLQGETPEEIAISILSEILMVKNKATGKNLRNLRRD